MLSGPVIVDTTNRLSGGSAEEARNVSGERERKKLISYEVVIKESVEIGAERESRNQYRVE